MSVHRAPVVLTAQEKCTCGPVSRIKCEQLTCLQKKKQIRYVLINKLSHEKGKKITNHEVVRHLTALKFTVLQSSDHNAGRVIQNVCLTVGSLSVNNRLLGLQN